MPVFEVRGGMRVLPNNVYVIPTNVDISLVDGSFRVGPKARVRGRDLAIDHFFVSLANQYKTRAIGIVLSGTMSDGALGLRAIKAEGGVTFAQDDESARFRDMPRAAVAAGAVDFVASPPKIAGELARMGRHPYVRPAPRKPEPELELADHTRILSVLRTATGVDFTGYRQTTVKRRIARRMALKKIESVKKYLEVLRKEPGEAHALYEDILITVTAFFRDAEVFKSLKGFVFPALLKSRPANLPIRIWAPGCSTGEEVYSIAICLFEALQVTDTNPPIQIFATDVSEMAIEKARAGIYLENSMVNVSPERVKRFFSKRDGSRQVSKSIRDVCIFARQNITSDPPFSNLDLISCRNLLIYLEPVLQKRVIPLLHYALRSNGYLLLGNAETISGFADLFTPVDRSHRIFLKRAGISRMPVDFRRGAAAPGPAEGGPALMAPEVTPVDLQKEADRVVLGRYAPAGVLVNEGYEVVQFRGRTSPYLEAASGAASFNVLKMAREGLLVTLRSALLKAKKTRKTVRSQGVHVRQNGDFRTVALEVVPMREDATGIVHYLVLFEETERPRKPEPPGATAKTAKTGARASHETIVKLEQELTATKDYLQSIIEEQEASNEELKSANEEILSSNEELQSTNEELETAKEELQSTNEELTTVNEELQNRNAELTQVNNDLQNLFTGTNLAVVMLDAGGRLRRFTPQAEKLLNLLPTDRGRRMKDIKPNLRISDLDEVLSGVIDDVETREREVQDQDGKSYLMRVRPYRTMDNRIDGAVIAFFDIDPIKRSLEQVNRARDYAEALVETVREALVVLTANLRVRTANEAFYRMFQASPLQTEGKPLLELSDLDRRAPELRGLLERTLREKETVRDLEASIETDALGKKILRMNARRVRLPGESEPLALLAIEDITERKRVEDALRLSETRYRLVFETAREGIWVMDARTGVLLDVNPFLQDLLGYSREELLGHKPWDLGLYEDAEAARSRFEAHLAGGFGFEQEVCLKTKTGLPVYVETVTNTYTVGDRLVTQATLRDVTERTKLQDQVRQMQKLDSIGRLAGGVAHDFNNLLNIISAHVALLARDGLAPDRRAESAQSIEKAVERGTAVVRQLLTFARKTDVAFEPTDVNEVVGEVASMLRETFPKEIRVVTKLTDAPARVRADPNQLHQALLNLAVNARDAMSQGGTLTLGTDVVSGETLRSKFPEASGSSYVELCVADTGGGMDAPTRRRIFEPFFTTKGDKGQGLGLAVVYGIVNAHRGWIDLETEAGKGTTFRLYVEAGENLEAKDHTREQRRKDSRQLTASAAKKGGRHTLLLVEDEEALLNPVRQMLEENGFEVLTALDGREAVERHAQNADRIDAVLLDLSLPRLGGWQAFLKMREINPALRCVVASGNLDPDQRQAMAAAGVQASVRKPYTGGQILKVLRSVLD
jgi:two-component system, chemotaxis family, CheB/CheR fusion protein